MYSHGGLGNYRADIAGDFFLPSPCSRQSRFSFWTSPSMGWILGRLSRLPTFFARSPRSGARSFFPFISLRTRHGSGADLLCAYVTLHTVQEQIGRLSCTSSGTSSWAELFG